MKRFRKFAFFLILICFSTVLAQDGTCTAMIQQAMTAVQNGCGATGRNQSCYGYVSLAATPREGVQNFTFSHQGDITNVNDLATLRLSAFNPVDNTWGVALMKLQANLPDSLPGQNVAFVLFGDVQLQNAVVPVDASNPPTVQVSARVDANIRSGPSTDYRVIGSLGAGDTAAANGRTQDASWLRIQLPNSEVQGWIQKNATVPSGDVNPLIVVGAAAAEVQYSPMQAFYFQSGIGQTNCTQAPPDGILVQTPAGVGKIDFRANDVDIQLGSTAFLQAQPDGSLIVTIIEGQGLITADGKTVVIPEGSYATVPLDALLHAAGHPTDAQPYNLALLMNLPILLLPIQITIAPPATDAQIADANMPTINFLELGTTAVSGDLSSLAALDGSEFCTKIDAVITQSGLSRDGYIDLLHYGEQSASGSALTQLQAVEAKIASCP